MIIPTSIFVLLCTLGASVLGLLLAGLIGATIDKGLHSSDVASWVQAIGATLGIAIAVWIPAKQKHDAAELAENDRKAEERRVCLAFRDELTLLAERFDNGNVAELLRDAPGASFERQLPIPRRRFPVFDAMVPRLTEIQDEHIRRGLIEAYDAANGLIDLVAMNNRSLSELSDMRARPNFQDSYAKELSRKQDQLADLRTQMQTVCSITIKKVSDVIPLLDSAIGPPPRAN